MDSGSRRKFLAACLGVIGATAAGVAAYPVFRYLSPQTPESEKGKLSIPRDQVALGQAHFFQFRGHPAVVLQKAPGVFVALSAVCTHLGCIVKWLPDKEEFLCPCHGGRYSSNGTVLGGPPPKPLPTIPLALSGNNLLIG